MNNYCVSYQVPISFSLKSQQYHSLDKRMDELKELYQTDMTLVEIAETLNVSRSGLQEKIKELGWTRKSRHKKKSINPRKLKELVALGCSDKQIQEKLNIGRFVLSRYKKELGFYFEDENKIFQGKKGAQNRDYYKKTGEIPECPCYTNILEKHKDEVIDLLKDGTLRTEIAKKYNVSRSTVFNFMHLYGIKSSIIKVCDKNEQVVGKQSEFHAAMGLANFPYIQKCILERKRVSDLYDRELFGFVQRPKQQDGLEYNYAYYPILLKNEAELSKLFRALNAQDIYPRRYFYPSLNNLPYI